MLTGWDYETYGDVDLKKHGLDRYINGPHFTPLLGCGWDLLGNYAVFDYVKGQHTAIRDSVEYLEDRLKDGVVAHNAGFERAVSERIGVNKDMLPYFRDSAVTARRLGAESKLEVAAPQLTGLKKLVTGEHLIDLFCKPNVRNNYAPPTVKMVVHEYPNEWAQFIEYCIQDARAGLAIEMHGATRDDDKERRRERVAWKMNRHGWNVNVKLIEEMQRRYEENTRELVRGFLHDYAAEVTPRFFGSTNQQREFCLKRGVRQKSFDKVAVERLLDKVEYRLSNTQLSRTQRDGLADIHQMLKIKQELGGSSLSKLQKILDTVGPDGRLRDQYVHIGAAQTYRTSARGAQLQNLKRLQNPIDMNSLFDLTVEASNTLLAENLRQVFEATDSDGELLVGDFASVESRMLAWIAGALWKTQAYRDGTDMYKLLASKSLGIPYDQIDSEQRREGKLGELSCGYGAGPVAVKKFGDNNGFDIDENKATKTVVDWRAQNPEAVDLWDRLTKALRRAVETQSIQEVELAGDLLLTFVPQRPPQSLQQIHAGAVTIAMVVEHKIQGYVMQRVFHGCYTRGRDICFYKPSALLGGPLWKTKFRNPDNPKEWLYHKLYGGKITGILVQSLCRELFMDVWERLHAALKYSKAEIVGQFHDELVVDTPEAELISTRLTMRTNMSQPPSWLYGFPLEVDVKGGHTYIK